MIRKMGQVPATMIGPVDPSALSSDGTSGAVKAAMSDLDRVPDIAKVGQVDSSALRSDKDTQRAIALAMIDFDRENDVRKLRASKLVGQQSRSTESRDTLFADNAASFGRRVAEAARETNLGRLRERQQNLALELDKRLSELIGEYHSKGLRVDRIATATGMRVKAIVSRLRQTVEAQLPKVEKAELPIDEDQSD